MVICCWFFAYPTELVPAEGACHQVASCCLLQLGFTQRTEAHHAILAFGPAFVFLFHCLFARQVPVPVLSALKAYACTTFGTLEFFHVHVLASHRPLAALFGAPSCHGIALLFLFLYKLMQFFQNFRPVILEKLFKFLARHSLAAFVLGADEFFDFSPFDVTSEHLLTTLFAETVLALPELECHVVSYFSGCHLNLIAVADGAIVCDLFLALIVNDGLLLGKGGVRLDCILSFVLL